MRSTMVTGFAAKRRGMPLERVTYQMPALSDQEVRVSITHCGLCYTDIHAIEDFYEITQYPFVPGHEIVGEVSETGKAVTQLKVGDRVGIGWQGRACMQCEWCRQGEVNMCQDIVNDASWSPHGGFSSSIAVDAGFVYALPPDMPSENAAVLMCAGITVFAPLRRYAVTPGLHIAIAGIGGLGHLAIQFARSLGYEVTALSSSSEKENEAYGFGAHHFLVLGEPDEMRAQWYAFDLILLTAHGGVKLDTLLYVLKKKGKLIVAGFPEFHINPTDLVAHQLEIIGTFLGTQKDMRDMLVFADTHSITPVIVTMPMSKVNDAIEKLKQNQARYRIVLNNDLD